MKWDLHFLAIMYTKFHEFFRILWLFWLSKNSSKWSEICAFYQDCQQSFTSFFLHFVIFFDCQQIRQNEVRFALLSKNVNKVSRVFSHFVISLKKHFLSKNRQNEVRFARMTTNFHFHEFFRDFYKQEILASLVCITKVKMRLKRDFQPLWEVEKGVKTGGKNWHAPCRWWERINFFVEYVNTHTHTQNSLAAERELTNWDKLMH